jgi:hypothetical protein
VWGEIKVQSKRNYDAGLARLRRGSGSPVRRRNKLPERAVYANLRAITAPFLARGRYQTQDFQRHEGPLANT